MPSMCRYFIWLTVRTETVERSGDRTVPFEHLHHLAALDHVFAFAQPAQLVDHGLQDIETLRCLDQRCEPVVVVTLVAANLGNGEGSHAHSDHTPVLRCALRTESSNVSCD